MIASLSSDKSVSEGRCSEKYFWWWAPSITVEISICGYLKSGFISKIISATLFTTDLKAVYDPLLFASSTFFVWYAFVDSEKIMALNNTSLT